MGAKLFPKPTWALFNLYQQAWANISHSRSASDFHDFFNMRGNLQQMANLPIQCNHKINKLIEFNSYPTHSRSFYRRDYIC